MNIHFFILYGESQHASGVWTPRTCFKAARTLKGFYPLLKNSFFPTDTLIAAVPVMSTSHITVMDMRHCAPWRTSCLQIRWQWLDWHRPRQNSGQAPLILSPRGKEVCHECRYKTIRNTVTSHIMTFGSMTDIWCNGNTKELCDIRSLLHCVHTHCDHKMTKFPMDAFLKTHSFMQSWTNIL
jgi:hypothetical protein